MGNICPGGKASRHSFPDRSPGSWCTCPLLQHQPGVGICFCIRPGRAFMNLRGGANIDVAPGSWPDWRRRSNLHRVNWIVPLRHTAGPEPFSHDGVFASTVDGLVYYNERIWWDRTTLPPTFIGEKSKTERLGRFDANSYILMVVCSTLSAERIWALRLFFQSG